jgi:hypothetical protein
LPYEFDLVGKKDYFEVGYHVAPRNSYTRRAAGARWSF